MSIPPWLVSEIKKQWSRFVKYMRGGLDNER
jgi:hypothetical protein